MELRIHRSPVDPANSVYVPISSITDDRLSLSARGFYAWMLANPETLNWPKTKIYELTQEQGQPCGKTIFHRMMKELEQFGYYEPIKPSKYNALYGKPGYIYMIGPSRMGEYKIGATTQPKQRLKSIRSAHGKCCQMVVCQATADMGRLEEALHIHFADHDKGGEWFDLDRARAASAISMIIAGEVA